MTKDFANVALLMELVTMHSRLSMKHGVFVWPGTVLKGVFAVGLVAEAMAAAAGFGKPMVGR